MEDIFVFPPPRPENESARLHQLSQLDFEAMKPRRSWSELTQLAASIADADAAWFCVITERTHRDQAVWGIDQRQIDRDRSLCAYTVAADQPLMVEDIRDHRFFGRHRQLYEAAEPFRAYCAVPIHGPAPPLALGTLAVADHNPRQYSAPVRSQLEMLGRQLETQLKLLVRRRQVRSHRRQLTEHLDESHKRFLNLRDKTLDLTGAIRSDARFIERLSRRSEIRQAARDIATSSESLEDLLAVAEGYTDWSRGKLKLMGSRLAKFTGGQES